MKGVSYWFWIAGGVIAGLIIFTIAYQQIVDITRTAAEHRNLEQFNEIKNIADNLCWNTPGNKREYSVSLSENVEGIYTTSDKYEEYVGEKLLDNIISDDSGTGKYLCIKVKDKRLECEELECNTTMPFIGAVPEEFSLSALVNNLVGKGKIFDYYLEFEKIGEDVNIKTLGYRCPVSFDQLIKCDNKNTVALLQNLLVIGDSTFFVDCCDQLSKPFETLLINSVKYFGGSKILIIWEDPQADPNANEKSGLINSIKENGFTVETLYHSSPISSEKLSNYDQVWLVRPGICENPSMKKYCDYSWKESEFEALKNYLAKGKIVLITDYPNLVPERVGNKVVKLVDPNAVFLKGCFCGCKGETMKADKVFEHEITTGIPKGFVG
jgi:hypothetical protein